MDLDSGSRPTKTISPVGKGWEHAPGLSVCLYGLSGFWACRRSSTSGHAKKVPDPTVCWDGHYDLSVTLPSCRGFHNQLIIFASFFSSTVGLLQPTVQL